MRSHFLTRLGVAGLVALGPGCRTGYEILERDRGDVLDEDSVQLEGDGDGDGGLGGATAAGGDSSGGGTPSGGAPSGGNSSGGMPSGGAQTGGGASGGAGTGGSGSDTSSGGSGPDLTPFHVESTSDVGGDADITTLREAIEAALATGGETITFEPGLTILLETPLPAINATITIVGNSTTFDFSNVAETPDCMTTAVAAHTLTLDGVTIQNCPGRPLLLSGGVNHVITETHFDKNAGPVTVGLLALGTTIGPGNLFTDGAGDALRVNGAGTLVLENVFLRASSNSSTAILLDGGSSGSQVIGNTIIEAGNGIKTSATSSFLSIWHNTIVGSVTNGIQADVGSQVDIRNNVITHSGASGIVGDAPVVTALDYNLYFSNGAHCSGCSGGLGANARIVDPMYVNAAGDNYNVQNGSQAIDNGDPGVAVDRNGGAAGSFFGSGPDIGAFETNY